MLNNAAFAHLIFGIEDTKITFFLTDINADDRSVLRIRTAFQIITFLSFETERFHKEQICWRRIGVDSQKLYPTG